jgi:glycosyltransferase involved in cell wall biosynthesis
LNEVLYVFHKSLTSAIPRLHGLSLVEALAGERRFTVLSFEPRDRDRPPGDAEVYDEIRNRLTSRGVRHVRLPRTGSTLLDIALGAAAIALAVVFRRVRIVHARSYIPAAMGLLACAVTPARLVFDMRGLFVDEYVFEGALPEGTLKLALARRLERTLLFRSAAVVVVSNRFRDHLLSRPDIAAAIDPERIHVVPNRADLARFDGLSRARGRMRRERGWEERVVAVYAGASGAKWHRVDQIMERMARAMEAVPELRLLVMTQPSADGARALAADAGVPSGRAEFLTVDASEVPSFLSVGDLGLMLIERHVSKDVCSPIKFAEYMASGLPVVAGGSMGDTADWIRDERLGILVDPGRIDEAARAVVELVASDDFRSGAARARCLEFAAREMDMRRSFEEYARIYRSLDGR